MANKKSKKSKKGKSRKNPPPEQQESASISSETPPETTPETPKEEAPAQPLVDRFSQLLKDAFENFKVRFRTNCSENRYREEDVNSYMNGLEIFLGSFLIRFDREDIEEVSQTSDLKYEAAFVFNTAIEKYNAYVRLTPEERDAGLGFTDVPIINDRSVAYNEATAPNSPPNPDNHLYASFGRTCHQVDDTKFMWQTRHISEFNTLLPPKPSTASSYPKYQMRMHDSLKKLGHELGIDQDPTVLFYKKLIVAAQILKRGVEPTNAMTRDDIETMGIEQLSLLDTYRYVKFGRLASENSQPIGPTTEFGIEQRPIVPSTGQSNWTSRRRRRSYPPSSQRNWEPPTDIQPFTMPDTRDPKWSHRFIADWVRRFVQKQFCEELGLENISLPFAEVICLAGITLGQNDFNQKIHEWLNRADKKEGDEWDVEIKWTARQPSSSENDKNDDVPQ
ncbi:unnamed protein product [Caenorhabditis nigoni]